MLGLKSYLVYLLSVLTLCLPTHSWAQDSMLETVKKRGTLKCGVSQGLPGFSNPNDKGEWQGIDVDMCRAVAAAVLNDAKKVQFVPLSAKERFTALQSGEIDLLARNTTWTFVRDTSLGIDFMGVLYYDGQGFMVPKQLKVKSSKELSGAVICTNSGTTTELNIADYFQSNHLKYEVVTFEKTDETLAAYEAGRCDVYSTDASGLAAQRLKLAKPEEHIILEDIISKEPLSPAVKQGDDQWANIVRWSLFAMLNAEELGVSKANIEQHKKSKNPNVARLLGQQGDFGERLGLKRQWAHNIIKQVGNYAEIYDRNVGSKSPLNIERNKNKLWNQGGLHYAPPLR